MPTAVQPGGAYVETPATPAEPTRTDPGTAPSALDTLTQYRTAGYTVMPSGVSTSASTTAAHAPSSGTATTTLSRSAYQAQAETDFAVSSGKTLGTIKLGGDKVLKAQFDEFVGRRMQAYDSGYLNVTTAVKQSDLDKVFNDTIAKAKTSLSSGTSNDLLAQIKASLAGLTGAGRAQQFAQSPNYSGATTSDSGSSSTWVWLALAGAGLVWWFRRKR